MSRTASSRMATRSQNLRQCLNFAASSSQVAEVAPGVFAIFDRQQGTRRNFKPHPHHQQQVMIPRRFYSYSSFASSPLVSSPLQLDTIPTASQSAIDRLPKRITIPLSSTTSSYNISICKDDGHRNDYVNPWDTSEESIIPPIDWDVRLDRQTRFLLQLLKEKRMHGLRNARIHRKSIPESLTTDKCHYWLRHLAAIPAASESGNSISITTTSLSVHCWQRAERARLILERMEVIADDFKQYCHDQDQRQHAADEGGGFYMHEIRRGILPSFPPLLTKSKALPIPTSETYLLVLKLYATKYLHGKASVPETCRAIVERMQRNAMAAFDAESAHKAGQENSNQAQTVSSSLSPIPTTQHWNQVIIAWANSIDPKRPIHAAQIAHALDEQGMADASTFSHALRACVSLDSRQQLATSEFVQLALPVAQKLQNGLLARQLQKKDDPTYVPLEAFHIVHLLRVARNLTSSSHQKQRNEMIRNTWQMATDHKKINVHVLQELLHVASPDLAHELVQPSEEGGDGTIRSSSSISAEVMNDALKLIQVLPVEWIDHGNPDQDPYQW